jgi:hypothetical protein
VGTSKSASRLYGPDHSGVGRRRHGHDLVLTCASHAGDPFILRCKRLLLGSPAIAGELRQLVKNPSLTMSAVSSAFDAHSDIHAEKRAISLYWKKSPLPTIRLACNPSVRNSVRPNHLSDRNLDHDYFFGLPIRGAGRLIINAVLYSAPRGFPGCPACEPNLFTGASSLPLRHIQNRRTASLRAIATFAIRRSRRIAR